MDFDQAKKNSALKNPAGGKIESEVRTINFADKRALAGEPDARRLFTPRNKINTSVIGATLARPRALLRMVSSPC